MISQLNRIARLASLAALLVPRTDTLGPSDALPRSLLGERRPFKVKTLGTPDVGFAKSPQTPATFEKGEGRQWRPSRADRGGSRDDETFIPPMCLRLAKEAAPRRQAYQNQSKIP